MALSVRDINSVGDELLEGIVKSLLTCVIGPGITPFSTGKDGAREATFKGAANYPSEAEMWEGHWIFQVKYCDLGLGIKQARATIKSHINKELKKLEGYEYFKNNKCDNYIFVTNVPFTGQAHIGLHDYISEKAANYALSHFDYWDGEKIIALLNAHSAIKDSFFEPDGFLSISKQELARIEDIYVQPEQYEAIRGSLLQSRIVAVIGQAHIGKTITSKYLANDILGRKFLNQIYLVQEIDFVKKIPDISNSVIIFDDLFGDIDFQTIGYGTKIIKSLIAHNYLIVTSRDYIYSQARASRPALEELISNVQCLLQEGSYSSPKLAEILNKHLAMRRNELSPTLLSLLLDKQEMIVNELRFPHNIDLFVASLDDSIQTRSQLKGLVKSSKKIETVVLRWITNLPEAESTVILVCALFRFVGLNDLINIVGLIWGYGSEIVTETLNANQRIFNENDGYIRFAHPSFKLAIYWHFLKSQEHNVLQILLDILRNDYVSPFLKRQLTLPFQDNIKSFTSDDLIEIQNACSKVHKFQPLIWCQLIKQDHVFALEHFLKAYDAKTRRREKRRILANFVKSKKCATKSKMKNLVELLFSRRSSENHNLLDYLITTFAHEIKAELSKYISSLDESDPTQLDLKIRLLGVRGTQFPAKSIAELERLGNHQNAKIRRRIYSSLNVMSRGNEQKMYELLPVLLERENNRKNIGMLKASIQRYEKIAVNRIKKPNSVST